MRSFHLLLFIATISCIMDYYCQASPVMSGNNLDLVEDCRNLCKHCNCVGFYCGEQCICECSKSESGKYILNRNRSQKDKFHYSNKFLDRDMKCVETMQNNCRKLDLPFEVLIQAPTKSQLVQELFAESENGVEMDTLNRKTRSTVSVYQPEKMDEVAESKNVEVKNESNATIAPATVESDLKSVAIVEKKEENVSEQESTEPKEIKESHKLSDEDSTTEKESELNATTPESNSQIKRFALYNERDFAKRDTGSDKNEAATLAENTEDESVGASNPAETKSTDIAPATAVPTAPAKANVNDTNVGAPLLFPPVLPLLALPFAGFHLKAINDHILKAHALVGAHLAKVGFGAPFLLGAPHVAGLNAAVGIPAHIATHLAAARAKLDAIIGPRLAGL